jgi:DNA-binding MarR family transcriptional regulator
MAAPTPRSESLFLALRQAYRLGGREYREGLRRHGLTARQATALLAIRRNPGEGVRFLADRIDADLPTCSALVTKLEARGLVERRDDPGDRRRTCLYVTAEAEDVARAVARARRAADARIEAVIGPEAPALRALLGQLIDRLQREAVGAAR